MSYKNGNPLVSIIIPVFNAEKYLKKCIESVINQTYQNIEVILIDDGSTDNSPLIYREYARKDNRLKINRQKNLGVSAARNNGIRRATGEYIIFIDADDWIEVNMIELMCDKLKKNKEIDICICGYKEFYEEKNESIKISLKNKISDKNFVDLILNGNNLIKGYLFNKMFRKIKIKKFFNENIAIKEDLIFLLSNFNEKTKYYILYEPLYNYRINSNSALHSKAITKRKITSLDADIWIAENIKSKEVYKYKISFIVAYYYYQSQLNIHDVKYLKQNYNKTMRSFYKDIMNDKIISIKEKMDIIMRRRLYFLYKIKKNRGKRCVQKTQ